MLTEADARRLEPGSSVALAAGGHVTPLALDTLRERRITLLRDGAVGDEARPGATRRRSRASRSAATTPASRCAAPSAITCAARDWRCRRSARTQPDPVDYPDTAGAVARLVARGEADAGIVIDGAGLGSAIAANKVNGVRAAMCTDRTLARYAREHNGANVLALGATLVTDAERRWPSSTPGGRRR